MYLLSNHHQDPPHRCWQGAQVCAHTTLFYVSNLFTLQKTVLLSLPIVWKQNCFIMRKRSRNVVWWQMDMEGKDWDFSPSSFSLKAKWEHICEYDKLRLGRFLFRHQRNDYSFRSNGLKSISRNTFTHKCYIIKG